MFSKTQARHTHVQPGHGMFRVGQQGFLKHPDCRFISPGLKKSEPTGIQYFSLIWQTIGRLFQPGDGQFFVPGHGGGNPAIKKQDRIRRPSLNGLSEQINGLGACASLNERRRLLE